MSYNAKEMQNCKICGLKFIYDGVNSFATHLKEHSINTNNYLLEYYYSKEQLKCSTENCTMLVELRNYKPKLNCDECLKNKNYGKGKDEKECQSCGNVFKNKDYRIKTCSKECAKELRSKKIKDWHKNMTIEAKSEHFKKIIQKTAMTRRKNNTPSWNSGKTGVYSKETIEKIRRATLKQLENQTFRKTKIEKIIESVLSEMGVKYKYSFILEKRQYDFRVKDYNLLIECDGDYWHGNPKFYPVLTERQKEKQKEDRKKDKIAKKNNYILMRFWEDEILNNLETVKKDIALYMASCHNVTGNGEREGLKKLVEKDNQQPSL